MREEKEEMEGNTEKEGRRKGGKSGEKKEVEKKGGKRTTKK